HFLEKNPKVLFGLARILAERLVATNRAAGIRFVQLNAFKITKEVARLLPLQVILRHRVLPIDKKDKEITVATVDPGDQVARNTVSQFLSRDKVNWVCISGSDFDYFRDKKLFDLVNDNGEASAPLVEELAYLSERGTPLEATSEAAQALDGYL